MSLYIVSSRTDSLYTLSYSISDVSFKIVLLNSYKSFVFLNVSFIVLPVIGLDVITIVFDGCLLVNMVYFVVSLSPI